ncbi:hypothetical protein Slala04_38670 [Streptomyces lavendulae subsp. lavendulae]|nr:hypothetical protein Slala04_38670 [Streptomyces lavendulae subsp. lavendulae]
MRQRGERFGRVKDHALAVAATVGDREGPRPERARAHHRTPLPHVTPPTDRPCAPGSGPSPGRRAGPSAGHRADPGLRLGARAGTHSCCGAGVGRGLD